ncbi:MAG: TRAP transporter small permease [Gammaproteobacteria bacterium]|nr:TRAP transporter small permease [Gammaproteobacteria bacterium]
MPDWQPFIYKIKHGLIVFEKLIACSSLILLLLLAIIQIVFRNFFEMGFSQIDIISRHLILFIIFMGAALVSEQNRHIKIDVLTHFLSARQKQLLVRPFLFFCAAVTASFAWYSIGFWLDEYEYMNPGDQLQVYLTLILPVGFSILSLHLLLISLTHFEHDKVLKDRCTAQSNDDYDCNSRASE